MKKTTFIITATALALAFGLSACTDAEMAQVERDMNQAAQSSQDMIEDERDCKVYVAGKTSLPMAAISVSAGNMNNGVTYIPVSVNWDEPYVNERGECKVVNGRTVRYRIID